MQSACDLKGCRVLIVEDEWLVAMEMESLLQSLGCTVLGPATTVDEASAIITREPVDAALLDLNLNGVSATCLAPRLASARARVIVVSGYGARMANSPDLKDAILLEKPVHYPALIRALESALG